MPKMILKLDVQCVRQYISAECGGEGWLAGGFKEDSDGLEGLGVVLSDEQFNILYALTHQGITIEVDDNGVCRIKED